MKKIIFIALLLLATSCYKTWVVAPEGLAPGYFYDEYYPCDTLVYSMNCAVFSDSAKLNFIKKAYIPKEYKTYTFGGETITVRKDTVLMLEEQHIYSASSFKNMLIEKNKIKRIDDGFYFSPNMEISWKAFDEIFNTYIK